MHTILQLNIEVITANKIFVLIQLATKYNVLVIFLQETHCINADRLVIANFSLAGSILSRKHGLAKFVRERLNWTLADLSPEGTTSKWLCVNVDGVNVVNVYKPPPVSLTPNATSTTSVLIGVVILSPQMESAWLTGPPTVALSYCTTRRTPPVSFLANGTLKPIQTWLSRVPAITVCIWIDVP